MVKKGQFRMVISVVNNGQLSVVKKRRFGVVIRLVK